MILVYPPDQGKSHPDIGMLEPASRHSQQWHFIIQDYPPVAHIIGKAAILIDPGVTQA